MWLKLAIALVLCTATLAVSYENYKIYDVTPRNEVQQEILRKLSENEKYDFFNLKKLINNTYRVMIAPEDHKEFLQTLAAYRFEFMLITSDVSKVLAREDTSERSRGASSRIVYTDYNTHKEMNEYLDQLAKTYPNRVVVKTVGKSYEGRFLKTIKITNGDGRLNKKVILIDGGIHAREWIAPASVLYVITQLVENFEANKALLKDYDWIVLPSVNPDGYEYSRNGSRMWRKTRQPSQSVPRECYGADPNRNFDFQWGGDGTSPDPCSDIYRGPIPFSEPETQALRDVILSLKGRCKFYLTVHSYGRYLLYPWGYAAILPETVADLDEVAQAGAAAIRNATGTEYTVGSSTNVLYAAAGASDDYAFAIGEVPISITMELPAGGLMGFHPPVASIDPYVKETWVGIKAMAEKVIEKY